MESALWCNGDTSKRERTCGRTASILIGSLGAASATSQRADTKAVLDALLESEVMRKASTERSNKKQNQKWRGSLKLAVKGDPANCLGPIMDECIFLAIKRQEEMPSGALALDIALCIQSWGREYIMSWEALHADIPATPSGKRENPDGSPRTLKTNPPTENKFYPWIHRF
jgi:hypothetical protein